MIPPSFCERCGKRLPLEDGQLVEVRSRGKKRLLNWFYLCGECAYEKCQLGDVAIPFMFFSEHPMDVLANCAAERGFDGTSFARVFLRLKQGRAMPRKQLMALANSHKQLARKNPKLFPNCGCRYCNAHRERKEKK